VQRLRREADEMEFKDAVIERFRAAAAAFEEGYSDTIEATISPCSPVVSGEIAKRACLN